VAAKAVAMDVGSHSIKAMVVRDGKHGLAVTRFCAVPASEGAAGLAEAGMPLRGAVAGLAGRDMTLRYSQVPPSPDWQLRNLIELEIQDLSSQSGDELAADYNILPFEDEEGGMETILLALARGEALQTTAELAAEAGGSVDGHVPNCIALYNVYLRCGPVEEDTVVCLANLGHETIDIALVRGVDLLFARNLSGGGKVLDDAISGAFNVSVRKAESLKKDLLDLDPASRGHYASGQAEKITMAAGGAASAVVSAIQSSTAFCKTQIKNAELRLDKVLLCGGSARLRGVRGMLREALHCPVELFDPFENVDLSQLPDHEMEQLQQLRSEAVVALGLAAGRLDDSLYSLEILPEKVKRRKRFVERTLYNIAATLVLVVLLVLKTGVAREGLETATAELIRVRRQVAAAEATHQTALELVEENDRRRALVAYLAEKSLPMVGVIHTLRALNATLPDALWIKQVELMTARGRGDSSMEVKVVGQGKELHGVNVGEVYEQFSAGFRAHPLVPEERFQPQVSPLGSGEALEFNFLIDYRPRSEEDR
jgi:type IV pilus assembly protein PilM